MRAWADYSGLEWQRRLWRRVEENVSKLALRELLDLLDVVWQSMHLLEGGEQDEGFSGLVLQNIC